MFHICFCITLCVLFSAILHAARRGITRGLPGTLFRSTKARIQQRFAQAFLLGAYLNKKLLHQFLVHCAESLKLFHYCAAPPAPTGLVAISVTFLLIYRMLINNHHMWQLVLAHMFTLSVCNNLCWRLKIIRIYSLSIFIFVWKYWKGKQVKGHKFHDFNVQNLCIIIKTGDNIEFYQDKMKIW